MYDSFRPHHAKPHQCCVCARVLSRRYVADVRLYPVRPPVGNYARTKRAHRHLVHCMLRVCVQARGPATRQREPVRCAPAAATHGPNEPDVRAGINQPLGPSIVTPRARRRFLEYCLQLRPVTPMMCPDCRNHRCPPLSALPACHELQTSPHLSLVPMLVAAACAKGNALPPLSHIMIDQL